VLAAICGLIVVGVVTSDLSTSAVVAGAALATLPVVPVVATFLWLDRWEPEPGWTLLFAFVWGGGVATLGSLIVNSVVDIAYGPAASSVVSAPMIEEGLKGTFLVGLLWLQRRELDGVVDGIVYAGMVAAGFAFVENILYLGRAIDSGGSDGAITFVMRCLLTPFAHPFFTAFIGIAVGVAARRRGVLARLGLPVIGYACAVVLHALWNAVALWDDGRVFLSAYVTVMMPLFAGMVVLALWQRRREQRVVATYAPRFAAAGWIPQSEVPLLSSMSGRRQWRRAVRQRSGGAAARAVQDYQVALTELAFLADRVARGTAGPEAAQWHAEILDAAAAARASVVGAAA
jgi:RsiW-degrading membrane proteinase PrsW (M82 family)